MMANTQAATESSFFVAIVTFAITLTVNRCGRFLSSWGYTDYTGTNRDGDEEDVDTDKPPALDS